MFILASASPRRRELVRQLGFDFVVVVSDVPEEARPDEEPASLVLRLAREKAAAVARLHPDAWVLGADTTVVLSGEALGKPVDRNEARDMLNRLSGRSHHVMTGVALIGPTGQVEEETVDVSEVEFRVLRDAEIDAYVATGEPLDKAGAYGIQGGAAAFVARVSGSYTNVVGLPLEVLRVWLDARHLIPNSGHNQ